jgi:hypothetical protein
VAVTGLAGRFVLALVFLIAGTSKVSAPRDFEKAIDGYRVVPTSLTAPVAAILPATEIIGALFLVLGIAPQVTALAMAVALLAFTGGMSVNLIRGRVIDCGCLGRVGERNISWFSAAVDLLLAVVAVCSAAWMPHVLTIWMPSGWWTERYMSSMDSLAIVGASTTATLGVFLARAGLGLHRLTAKAKGIVP